MTGCGVHGSYSCETALLHTSSQQFTMASGYCKLFPAYKTLKLDSYYFATTKAQGIDILQIFLKCDPSNFEIIIQLYQVIHP